MAISDRITSIEEHIKESYQELEGIGIDTTGVDKNLENIPKLIDGYWETLPKVTGEGTSITLDNTKEGKMKIVLKGNTYQDSTTGKNLLSPNTNKNATSSNGITYTPVYDGDLLQYVNVNGTASADSSYLIQNASRYDIDNTKSYIFTGCPSGGSSGTYSVVIYYYDENNGYLGGVYDTGTGRTIPTASKILTNIYIKSGQTINNLKFYPMLRLSSVSDATYEPYTNGASPNPDYPQDIHVVSGDNTINVESKNLLDEKGLLNATFITGVYKYTKANFKGDRELYVRSRLKEGKSTISGLFVAISSYGSNPNAGVSKYAISNGNVSGGSTIQNFSGYEDLYVAIYPTTYTWQDVINNYDIWVCTQSGDTYSEYQGQQSYPVNLPVENLLETKIATETKNGVTITHNEDGSYTLNGTATAGFAFESATYSQTFKAGTYILGLSATLPNGLFYSLLERNVYYFYTRNGIDTATHTFDEDTTISLFREYMWIANGTTFDNFVLKPQLEKGNKVNSYNKYGTTPIELLKIGTYQDKIDKSSGKNLLDYSTCVIGDINGSTGQDETQTMRIRSDFIKIEPSTSYVCSLVGGQYTTFFYTNDKTYIAGGGASWINSGTSFTTPNNAEYVRLKFWKRQNTAISLSDLKNVMFNIGTTALPYEPYGTGWYVKKEIGKVILDENSAINFSGSYGGYYRLTTSIDDIYVPSENNYSLLSNYFKGDKGALVEASAKLGAMAQYRNGKIIYMVVAQSSGVDFKTWLSTHNTIVYYVLATPTYETITDTTLLSQLNALARSYASQTNISQESNDNASILNATALSE